MEPLGGTDRGGEGRRKPLRRRMRDLERVAVVACIDLGVARMERMGSAGGASSSDDEPGRAQQSKGSEELRCPRPVARKVKDAFPRRACDAPGDG